NCVRGADGPADRQTRYRRNGGLSDGLGGDRRPDIGGGRPYGSACAGRGGPARGDRARRDRRRVSGQSAGGGRGEGHAVTHPASGCGRLAARHLSLAYDKVPVCRDVSLDIPGDEFTVIIGPNGCGKSTLLKALARSLRPVAGQVLLDDALILSYGAKEVAR